MEIFLPSSHIPRQGQPQKFHRDRQWTYNTSSHIQCTSTYRKGKHIYIQMHRSRLFEGIILWLPYLFNLETVLPIGPSHRKIHDLLFLQRNIYHSQWWLLQGQVGGCSPHNIRETLLQSPNFSNQQHPLLSKRSGGIKKWNFRESQIDNYCITNF